MLELPTYSPCVMNSSIYVLSFRPVDLTSQGDQKKEIM